MTDRTATLDIEDVLAVLAEPEVRADPYPVLRRLREQDPVHLTSRGFYVLTRYADVRWAFEHTGDAFLGPDQAQLADQYPEAERHQSQRLFLNSLAMKNPPEHGRLRAPVERALNTERANGLLPRIGDICDRLLDEIAEPLRNGEVVDLHNHVSLPLCTSVFSELIGVPPADAGWLAGLIVDIYTSTMPLADEKVASIEERFARANARTAELSTYFQGLFDQRRRLPRDDLISALVAPTDETAEPLDDEQMTAMMWALWITGVETAAGGLDQGLRALVAHRDHLHWLRGTPGEVDAFGEEAMRLYGSSLFAGIIRIATRDVTFGDVVVPAGAQVRLSCAAANRDPAVFPDPDRFDPSRSHDLSLSWGAGAPAVLRRATGTGRTAGSPAPLPREVPEPGRCGRTDLARRRRHPPDASPSGQARRLGPASRSVFAIAGPMKQALVR